MDCSTSMENVRSLIIDTPTSLAEYSTNKYVLLASLNLSGNMLTDVDSSMFKNLLNLLVLDLSDNDIGDLKPSTFTEMTRLQTLHLAGNTRLSGIYPGTFKGLNSVTKLELKNMNISVINSGTFIGLESLRVLNISHNIISSLPDNVFEGLGQLNTLDLRGNPIQQFSSSVFHGLDSLKTLVSDLYLLCCIRPSTVSESQCLPKPNEFSSCDDLMRNEVLRAFVWIIGLMALLGNALAVVYRLSMEISMFKTGNGVLLTNLNLADFLMGVYLIIIGSADSHFRGEYVWNDLAWRGGQVCRLAGVLAFVSCEVSCAFLCMITIDRFITIRFTLHKVGFTRNTALLTCLALWAIFVSLALIPLVGLGYFGDEFYTKSGVCLALPLTKDRGGGWEYATAIFVFLNFFMFVFIAVGQFLIFREIRKHHMAFEGKEGRKRRDDVAIARKLSFVVMTNFLCLFPICIMGLMAMSGSVIDSEVYAWVAVFVLPLNSATNPIIYTLSSLFSSNIGKRFKKMCALGQKNNNTMTEAVEAVKLQKMYDSDMITLNYRPSVRTLTNHMEKHILYQRDMTAVSKAVAEALHFLHKLGYVAGPFTCDEVLLGLSKSGMIYHVSLLAMPIYSDTSDDISGDIGNLGLVVKRMIAECNERWTLTRNTIIPKELDTVFGFTQSETEYTFPKE